MQSYELPGKLISGIMKKRSVFMESRRTSLEGYLMCLASHHEICKFPIFRRFICHPDIIKLLYGDSDLDSSPTKKSFLTNVFQSVDDTVDTLYQKQRSKLANNPPVLLNQFSLGNSSVFAHSSISATSSPEPRLSEATGDGISSNVEPLIDLCVELFDIRGLRRQAIVIFLQNLFENTVERKLTEGLRDTLTTDRVLGIITSIRDNFWPNGTFVVPKDTRDEDEKIRSKFDSTSKIIQLFPELFGGMVGRQNARKGAVRVCTVFQNPWLNKHLMYRILDEILSSLFPKSN
jgi:sorting nexin-25